MNNLKFVSMTALALLMAACEHPIEIIGNGDVLSATGTRNCYLEYFKAGHKNCTENTVVGEYQETYYAVARSGWQFERWENYCADGTTGNECSFFVLAETVKDFHGQTVPPLVAVFTQVVDSTSSVTLAWDPPTRRQDGSYLSINELSHYQIAYTAENSGKTGSVNVPGGITTTYTFNSLPKDTYRFTMQAIDKNNLASQNSNMVVL